MPSFFELRKVLPKRIMSWKLERTGVRTRYTHFVAYEALMGPAFVYDMAVSGIFSC